MTDEPFSNREIKAYFENHTRTLDRIEKMFSERITPIEKDMAEILLWREGIMGKISVVVIVLGSVWTFFVAVITKKL